MIRTLLKPIKHKSGWYNSAQLRAIRNDSIQVLSFPYFTLNSLKNIIGWWIIMKTIKERQIIINTIKLSDVELDSMIRVIETSQTSLIEELETRD